MRKWIAGTVLALALLMSAPVSAVAPESTKALIAVADAITGIGDWATALRIVKAPAERRASAASVTRGDMFCFENGVPQDYAEAVKLYRLAAEQGAASAQKRLGGMYFTGQGVIQDTLIAHMWWNLAAAQSVEVATKNRDIVAKEMTPTAVKEADRWHACLP